MPQEIEELQGAASRMTAHYEEIAARAQHRVVDWRWTTGWVDNGEQVYARERNNLKPGRLLRKRGGDYGTLLGLDRQGRIVVQHHFVGHPEHWSESFRVEDDLRVTFVFERDRWRPVEDHLRGVELTRVLRDVRGRAAGRAVASSHDADDWRLERYVFDGDDRVVAIDEQFGSPASRGRTDIAHREDGSVDRIRHVNAAGVEHVVYARLDEPIAAVLAEVESALRDELGVVLRGGLARRWWAVALVYSDQAPLPPRIAVCSQRERDSWAPGGDQEWDLLNPAEWSDAQDPQLQLSETLDARMQVLCSALRSSSKERRGRDVLRRVARGSNLGPVVVFAREATTDVPTDDIRASLPPQRYEELRAAGLI